MSTQSFELAFFTIGELEGLSGDATTRTAHIDIPADCLPVAATLQSARQWLARIFHACSQRRAQRGIAARI